MLLTSMLIVVWVYVGVINCNTCIFLLVPPTYTTMHDRCIMHVSPLPTSPYCEMMEKQKQQEESQLANAPLTQAVLFWAVSTSCFAIVREGSEAARGTRSVELVPSTAFHGKPDVS